jgi:hypothetical protein
VYDPGIGGYNKVYAIMIDTAGNTIWERTFSNSNSYGRNATYDNLNNVIYIVGNSRHITDDIYVVKLDTAGSFLNDYYFD